MSQSLSIDGTYILSVNLFNNGQNENVRRVVDQILSELWVKDPQSIFLVTDDVCEFLCKRDFNARIKQQLQFPEIADLNSFTELLRGARFRGLFIVVVGNHEKEGFQSNAAPQFIRNLIGASPSAAWWKFDPISSLELMIKSIVDNDDADVLLVSVDETQVCVATRELLRNDLKCHMFERMSDPERWACQYSSEEFLTPLGHLIWEHSAFLREGFPADSEFGDSHEGIPSSYLRKAFDWLSTESPARPARAVTMRSGHAIRSHYYSKIIDWVSAEASPWSSAAVAKRINDIVDSQAYLQTDRSEAAITLLSLFRIARWLAVQNLEGTPLSTTFFAYPNCSNEGEAWEKLFRDQGETINLVLERNSFRQTVSVAYRDKIKKLAELALNSRAFLKVDLSSGQIVGMCEDHLVKEDSRFDRFGQLTACGGVIVHARPEGYVEVYSGGEFVLWFDGFDWHSRPFQILDAVCEVFFKADFPNEKERADVKDRLKYVVAELLDNQRSSILVLAPRDAIEVVQKSMKLKSSLLHTTRREVEKLFLRDIQRLHISTLSTLLSMDGAHFISAYPEQPKDEKTIRLLPKAELCEIGLLFKSEKKPSSQTDLRTAAGSGTDAARMLSDHVRASFVLKVSGSGDLKIFHQGVRLWSSNPSDWPKPTEHPTD